MNDFRHDQLEMIELMRELREQMRAVAVPQATAIPVSGLTLTQQKVFQQIEQIPGNDLGARRRIQRLLNELRGEPLSKEMTNRLKVLLKGRKWGVKCTCGQPA